MKKFAAACIGIGVMFALTGCGNNISVSDEQNDLIAEYIAGVMLKRSYQNGWNYQKLQAYLSENEEETTKATGLDTLSQQPTKSTGLDTIAQSTKATTATTAVTATKATQAAAPKEIAEPGSVSSEAEVMNSLKSALGLAGADITYTKKVVGMRYPQGEYLVGIPANDSCRVVALEFNIVNNTSNDIVANTAGGKVSLRLGVDGTTIVKSASILKNDITGLKGVTIKAGENITACAIFQVPETFVDTVKKADTTLSIYAADTPLGKMKLEDKTQQ